MQAVSKRVPRALRVPSSQLGLGWPLSHPSACAWVTPWLDPLRGNMHVLCCPDPCHNGGSCSDSVGTFFCECLAGFRGPKCEEDINECASNPCKNGANCTDCVNSYTCTCPSGFSGIHCENNTPDCTERYCLVRGGPRTVLGSLTSPVGPWGALGLGSRQPAALVHVDAVFVFPAPASTVGPAWMASTRSPASARPASRAATASTTSTSATPSPASTGAPARTATGRTSARVPRDTPGSTAR